jgi:hypothetical protein
LSTAYAVESMGEPDATDACGAYPLTLTKTNPLRQRGLFSTPIGRCRLVFGGTDAIRLQPGLDILRTDPDIAANLDVRNFTLLDQVVHH